MKSISDVCMKLIFPEHYKRMIQAQIDAQLLFKHSLDKVKSNFEPIFYPEPVLALGQKNRILPSVPSFIYKIYTEEEKELKDLKNVLNLNFTGDRFLAYFAILHDPRCLNKNGSIDLNHTKVTVNSILKDIESKKEFFDLDFSEEAQERILLFLERMKRNNRQLLCAIQGIKFEWLAQGKCKLNFGEIESFNHEVGELAGQILFNYHSKALPRARDINRIIILVPGVSDLIYKLGAAEKLVGVGKKDKQLHSNQVVQVCRGENIDFDLIDTLKPDLILASPRQVKQLPSRLTNQPGIEIYTVLSNQDTADLILQLGKLLDVAEKTTNELALGYNQRVSAVPFTLA